MRNYFNIILLLIFLSMAKGFSQNQIIIDSLQVALQEAPDKISKSEVMLELARLYWKTDYKQSIDYAQEAIGLMKDMKTTSTHVKAYRYLGNAYLFAGQFDESLKHLFESLKLAREVEDNFELFAVAVSIGGVYDRLENFEESIKYFFEALSAYNKSKGTKDEEKMSRGAIALYNNIGNYYLSNNEPLKAEEYYLKSLSLAESVNDLYNIGATANNLGKVKAAQNQYDGAVAYFEKSEEVRKISNDKSGLGKTYYFMAEFYLHNGDFQKAINYGNRSIEMADEVGALLTKRTAAKILTLSYDSLGDYSRAYIYHKVLKEVSDSIINENTIAKVTRLKFLNEQAIIDNERLKEKQQTKTRNTFFISILIVGLVILASLLIAAKNRQKRVMLEKKEFESRVAHKKKELATNVLYLLRKNETIESVTKKLLDLKKNVTKGNKDAVQRIIMELQSEIDTNSWKEFEMRFQDVHQGFYEKLQLRYPELTPSERKLAAFLKLNMSSKEISVITGQSIRSLEVARYRLRKKLDITNKDVNLINFLADL